MAERETGEINGYTSEEHDQDSDKLMLHNPVKLLHKYHLLLLILAFGTSVILQAVLRSEGIVGFWTALADFNMLLFVMGLMNLLVWMCSWRSATYIVTGALVLEDYVLLTTLNKKYLEMFSIPIMIIAFISALWYSLRVPTLSIQSEYPSGEITLEKEKNSEYQSEEALLKKDTPSEYQSEEVLVETNMQSEYQNDLLETNTQSEYQNEDILLKENTHIKYQNEDVLSQKGPQGDYQSGYISFEKEKQRQDQSEEDLLKKDIQREYQSEEVILEEDTQSEYQSEEVLFEENAQSEYENEEILLKGNTQSEFQKEEVLSEKSPQGEYQSGDISLAEDNQREYESEEFLLKKDTKSKYQSEVVILKEERQREYQSKEVLLEENTQSEYRNEEVLSEKGTEREYKNEELPSEKDTQSEYQNESGEDPIVKCTQWKLMKIAMVPYFIQLSLGVWFQYKGQLEDGIFIVSNFLLFFTSALCALTVMMASPPFGLNSCVVVQVLPVMHKTGIIVLMVTAHSMAAEWLREDIVFVCMPELTAVLAWFTIYFHHPGHGMSIKVATSRRSGVIILCSVGAILVFLASFYAGDMRVFCISSSSSALSYFLMWLLDQWPGNTADSNRLVQLLKFSSKISFYVAALVGMLCVDQQMLHDATSRFRYEVIAAAHFLFTSRLVLQCLRRTFMSLLCILLVQLVNHYVNIPGQGVRWLQRPQIETQRRPCSNLEMSTLQSKVDVLDNKLNELMPQDITDSVDLSSIHGKVKGVAYWLRRFPERVDANNADDATAHIDSQDIEEWLESAARHHDTELFHEVQSGIDEVTEDCYMIAPAVNPKLTGLYADSSSSNMDKEIQTKYLEKMLTFAASKGREVVCVFAMDDQVDKSALALEVCERIKEKERIKGMSCCHKFVSVSVGAGWKPDMAKLIMNMIEQVDSEHIGTDDAADVYQLTQSLKQLLQNQRYIIMIDNLRSNDDWGKIEACFPENNLGSRIIITTSFEDVAKASDHFYWIPLPLESEVETLFSRKISGSMSGVFVSKPHTKYPCEKSGLRWTELEQMKQFIKVRYNGLSKELRACLLYLSIFPENHEIDLERLVRLWIANGFIRGQDGSFMEDTAGCYIDEFIARKLIKPSQWSHYGTPRSCTVHPLIHEFIVWQATENKFVNLVHAQQRGVALSPSNPTVRWLSMQNSTKLDIGADLSYVRSVTVFGKASALPPRIKLSSKRLRVLDLGGCEGSVLLDNLWELLQLRYLSLGGTDISKVPAKIGELIYLQTLDVRSTKVKVLPPSIVRLENLMHLLAGNAELPHEISKMKALVTLSCANIRSWGSSASVLKELGEIANLRELELFCEVTQSSGDKKDMTDDGKQVVFVRDGFQTLNKLHIQGSFPSMSFEIGALPNVQVLELNFKKGHPGKSAGVSGIEHLLSLEHVLLEFAHHGGGTMATYAAVREVSEIHPNKHLKVTTINVHKSD